MDAGLSPQTPQMPPVVLGYLPADPQAMVPGDVPCRKCSYNLRGLPVTGRCPECGTPVGLSISGDLLRYSDPDWLAKLAKGLSFMLWGILVAFVLGFVSSLLFQKSYPGFHDWVTLIGSLLSIYGAWLLTEPDPSGLGEAQYAGARKLVRVALLIGVASGAISALMDTLTPPKEVAVLGAIIAGGAGLFGVVGEFSKFLYLEKLALRIPDQTLASRAHTVRWGYAVTFGILIGVGALMAVILATTPPSSIQAPIMVAGCFMLVDGIALLVFVVMALFLYYRLRNSLLQQEKFSREVWGSSMGQPA